MEHEEPGKLALVFGPYRLDLGQRKLCRDDTVVKLGGRAIDLLVALVERAGEVLSRAELEALVWPRTVVEDSSLRVHIAALRKALGDGVGGARYIANVPGRGYSFVGVVERLPGTRLPVQFVLAEHRLPARLTPVIGRERMARTLLEDLPVRRFASIVGHGGIGKTALALSVAGQLESGYRHGACFVDLALITEPAHVPAAVATAMGLAAGIDADAGALEASVQAMHMLLVIDNCEHVLDATALLVERMLRAGAGINVLATSREPLDAEGEWVYRLYGLESPVAERVLTCEEALAYPALRLLVERASARSGTFALSDDNLEVACALCRRLDGVPLAIEFAAARVGTLGIHEVAGQLDDRLGLLGTGRRTALPRHRTLRTLLDWSYDMLSPLEQRVLRGCALFKGAFTLASAVSVVADGDLTAGEVRNGLVGIVGKSLVIADIEAARASYCLLSITRAYALDLLLADAGHAMLAARHARHMIELMRRLEARWESVERAAWMVECQNTLVNIRAALEWAGGPEGDTAIALDLTAAVMLPNLQILSEAEIRDGAARLMAAVEAGAEVDPVSEARVNIMLAQTISGGGAQPVADSVPVSSHFDRALVRAAQIGRADIELETLYHMTVRAFGWGDYNGAYSHARRSALVARRMGDEAAICHADRLCAQSAHFLGDHRSAQLLAERVLANGDVAIPLRLSSVVDRRVSMSIILARIHWLQGRGAAAAELAQRCLQLSEDESYPSSMIQSLSLAAIPVALWRGEPEVAAVLVAQLESALQRYPAPFWRPWLLHYRRLVARGRESAPLPEPTSGKHIDHLCSVGCPSVLSVALARGERGLVGWTVPEALRQEGERLLHANGLPQAEQLFTRGRDMARQQHATAWELRCATSLAKLWLAQGRSDEIGPLLLPVLGQMTGDHCADDVLEASKLVELTAPRLAVRRS